MDIHCYYYDAFWYTGKAMKYWLLAYVVISLLVFDPKLHTGGDESIYIILAESLVSGEGYRNLQLIGKPLHRKYPPGLPLLLAPIVGVFGRDVVILKLFIVLTGVVGYAFFIKITERIAAPFWGELALIAYLLTPVITHYGTYVLSEVPFTTLVMGSIWLLLKKN